MGQKLDLLNEQAADGDTPVSALPVLRARQLWSEGDYFRRGESFDTFELDYYGNNIIVEWYEPGIATYRPDCHPDCEDEEGNPLNLDSDSRTTWNAVSSPLRWIHNLTEIGVPIREGIRVPVP